MDNFKDELKNIIESINFLETIDLKDIPQIELYMDQVTTFIDDKLKSYKRYANDKILTKTMINNYTKAKLLPPPNRKKYSKNHIILLILIYHMKSVLSITDIHTLFNSVNINLTYPNEKKEFNEKNEVIEKIYTSFVKFQENKTQDIFSEINFEGNIEEEDKTLLILIVIMLVIQAENQKMLAEKIIDTFFATELLKKNKQGAN